MQKSTAEMAEPWLTRRTGGLCDAGSRVLRGAIERLPVARNGAAS